ncbi:MAG: DUF1566 domain-containing protein [Deltaproteobacteria bacterium]|nr:DUF1566 domain-containing protein [Deltaproteobacteria bacterium]
MTTRQKLGKIMLVTGLLTGALLPVAPARAGTLPATGQTTAYPANKNDGIPGAVNVPDDGTLQRGASLNYKVLNDGTLKDVNTGLIWEVKCRICAVPGLHSVNNVYRWSGNGSQETIWDWLEDINAEGGTGYAGHNDWRIPNVRELQSIVDYGAFNPSIDPVFIFTAATDYWSSSTTDGGPLIAWDVHFGNGAVVSNAKSNAFHVRAVRGGPK